MPILEIRALPQAPNVDPHQVLKRVCISVAKATGMDPRHVWGTWEEIPSGWYVEGAEQANDEPTRVQPSASHPPIVRLTSFEGKAPEDIEKMLCAAAETLADALSLAPGNVFVKYDEGRRGHVYSGGQVIKPETYVRERSE